MGLVVVGSAVFDYIRAPYSQASQAQAKAESERWHRQQLTVADRLHELTPEQFEAAVARAFGQRFGFDASVTSFRNDGGRDIELRNDGRRILVECKQFAAENTVGRPLLQKLHSASVTETADGAIFITTGRYSAPARDFAQKHGIELYDGEATLRLFQEAFPVDEHPDLVWALCPRCAASVFVDTRYDHAEVKCSAGHGVPHPVPKAAQSRQAAAMRDASRERAKNVDIATFVARRPDMERMAIRQAEQRLARWRADIDFDRRWAAQRQQHVFATADNACVATRVINEVLARAAWREARTVDLEQAVVRARVAHEKAEAMRRAVSAAPSRREGT